ncbi:MAG: UDP-N-acetylglucosamine 2-epimerase (non-hydrolyzing) [Magnetospirillum sp.]|nr:UDP-N-acetylglucosamine 2-epimerase (non-hydrolyzing) [Magnetospirillum sp.]
MRTAICVVGARPNLMKIAPIVAALKAQGRFKVLIVHTGQHYDSRMSDSFFADLGIPAPDVNLEVGSASHAVQTAEVMKRFEPVLDQAADPFVLVVGDVNSTLACALVAAKKGVPVAHVEAGLRSWDRAMPEEINRILTDQLSDLLFTTERSALGNLVKEGIPEARVHFVGNVMIDTLRANLGRAVPVAATLAENGVSLPGPRHGVLTLHRPSNVDEPEVLARLMGAARLVAAQCPLVFPVHPRTRSRIEQAGLDRGLAEAGIVMIPPQGYLSMLGLMRDAQLVLTDSGGIQEETTALGVPCLTLRDNTERPITIDEGTNLLIGTDAEDIVAAARTILATGGKGGRIPEYWDGKAAERIAQILADTLGGSGAA